MKKRKDFEGSFPFKNEMIQIDGLNVRYEYDEQERHIGEVIAGFYQRKVWMVPKINKPDRKRTPDYYIDTIENGYDLKTVTHSGKSVLKGAIRKKKKRIQANKFIFDLTKSDLSDDQIKEQIREIFHSPDTAFVIEIVIMKNDRVVRSYKRDKKRAAA